MIRFKSITKYKFLIFIFLILFLFLWYSNKSKKHEISENFLRLLEYQNQTQKSLLESFQINCEEPDENFDFFENPIEKIILKSKNKCEKIQKLFDFNKIPLSKEENDYPLAYGILAYKNVAQFLFMLSSFYQPQNVYCVAYPQNSDEQFKKIIKELKKCWNNVYFFERPKVEWGSTEVINSVVFCLEFLTELSNEWKYFQYLSGVDIPIRTNLEMVKIFKAMKEAPNFEITHYQKERIMEKSFDDSPLPLWKSSLSSLIPRKTAKAIISSDISRNLLHFLDGTWIPDESFWATILGNKKLFNISGSLEANEFLSHQRSDTKVGYYISRYQSWDYSNCYGYFTQGSCVFGIHDLWHIRLSKHLVAHKFYLDYQPAAYFCLLKEHRHRSLNPLENFPIDFYSKLPQVELINGITYDKLTHKDLI